MKTTIALLISLAVCGFTLTTNASAQSRADCRNMCGISLVPGIPEQGKQQTTREQNSCYRTCMQRTPRAGTPPATVGSRPRNDQGRARE
jgi:hypothetical protein